MFGGKTKVKVIGAHAAEESPVTAFRRTIAWEGLNDGGSKVEAAAEPAQPDADAPRPAVAADVRAPRRIVVAPGRYSYSAWVV